MRFQYQAKQRNGQAMAGELEAATLAEARLRLRSQGLFVTALSSQSQYAARAVRAASRGSGGVRKSDLVIMMSQLSIMSQSGIDLAEALHNLAEQCPKANLRKVLAQVDVDVSSGHCLSDALRKHPAVFDDLFVASIAAGEQSGTITQVLERLTYLLRGDMQLRNTIWSMLMYPLVLAAVTLAVMIALVFFVLPQFATVFETLERPVPYFTQLMLNFGVFVRGQWLFIGIGLIALGVSAFFARRAPQLRKAWDYTTLHLALLRDVTRGLLTGRTFRLLGTMLMSGVPLIDGIRLCRNATGNRYFRQLFQQLERDVLNGEGLGRPLLSASFLPSGAAQMVVTAERSGKMGEVLKTIGEYYEDEGERCLRDLVKIAEPAVIVCLGVVVAGIVLSIVVPMLDVTTSSQ